MAYIALRTLNTKRRLIRKGERVPANYPLLKVALKRGWITEESNFKPEPIVEPAVLIPEPLTKFQMYGSTILEPELIPKTEEVVPEIAEAPEPEVEAEPEFETEIKAEFKGSEESFTDEVSFPESTPPLIANLEFLSNRDITKLTEKGIVNVMDLEGWTVEQLIDIRGIGLNKANRLLDAHADYEKSNDL